MEGQTPKRGARPRRVRPHPPVLSSASPTGGTPRSAFRRFLAVDEYRAKREWMRYEGTAQRDLFRMLRERFLLRHSSAVGWAVDLGAGPGRFTPLVGGLGARKVALDLSVEMLRFPTPPSPDFQGAAVDKVRGDAARPPLRAGRFSCVAALGNIFGFAGPDRERLLESAVGLIGKEGRLLLELAPGPGERSAYLARLPGTSVARLLRSPVAAILPRVRREPFRAEPQRKKEEGEFVRISAEELTRHLVLSGFSVEEVLAVAPALGPDAERAEAVRADPKAWLHLLELEEALGRDPDRWPRAAAVLVAAHRPPSEIESK